ncbi:MAG: hypothetical protein JWQ32_2140 [Marmoricola sp.]|nr:hypothetical protein [Marmoricola sp.]
MTASRTTWGVATGSPSPSRPRAKRHEALPAAPPARRSLRTRRTGAGSGVLGDDRCHRRGAVSGSHHDRMCSREPVVGLRRTPGSRLLDRARPGQRSRCAVRDRWLPRRQCVSHHAPRECLLGVLPRQPRGLVELQRHGRRRLRPGSGIGRGLALRWRRGTLGSTAGEGRVDPEADSEGHADNQTNSHGSAGRDAKRSPFGCRHTDSFSRTDGVALHRRRRSPDGSADPFSESWSGRRHRPEGLIVLVERVRLDLGSRADRRPRGRCRNHGPAPTPELT